MSQKKRYVFLGIIICGLFVISAKLLNVVKETYSRYRSDVDVAVQSTTGEMVCTLTVDTDETYIQNNTAYFKIRVKNYKEDVITASLSTTQTTNSITVIANATALSDIVKYEFSMSLNFFSFSFLTFFTISFSLLEITCMLPPFF